MKYTQPDPVKLKDEKLLKFYTVPSDKYIVLTWWHQYEWIDDKLLFTFKILKRETVEDTIDQFRIVMAQHLYNDDLDSYTCGDIAPVLHYGIKLIEDYYMHFNKE